MKDIDRLIQNSLAYVWLGLMIAALIGAIFFHAEHHFFSAGICYLMYKIMYVPKPQEQGQTK